MHLWLSCFIFTEVRRSLIPYCNHCKTFGCSYNTIPWTPCVNSSRLLIQQVANEAQLPNARMHTQVLPITSTHRQAESEQCNWKMRTAFLATSTMSLHASKASAAPIAEVYARGHAAACVAAPIATYVFAADYYVVSCPARTRTTMLCQTSSPTYRLC